MVVVGDRLHPGAVQRLFPNLVQLHDYYRRTWGASNLGWHVPPPASTKFDPYGAATDERFPNRQVTVDVMGWTIAHSAELGINTIHDYVTQQMWKPLIGWRSAAIGSPGGDWIHVETTPAAFLDGRSVEDRLSGGTTEVPLDTNDQQFITREVNEVPAETWKARVQPSTTGWPSLESGQALGDTRVAVQDLPAKLARLEKAVADLTALVQGLTVPGGDQAALLLAVEKAAEPPWRRS